MKRTNKTFADRAQLEELCIEKIGALQAWWKNPSGDWEFVREYSDERLKQEIKDAVGQIRFEKTLIALGWLLGPALVLSVLYLAVRFVKWAWYA